MNRYSDVEKELKSDPRTWLVTGAAGFIGSHLCERLLVLDQRVIGLDNFATGSKENVGILKGMARNSAHGKFEFFEGDVTDSETCQNLVRRVDHVLHQAALGSVPRSISDPVATNMANVSGFLNVLQASKEQGVRSFVYAASSSTYGDSTVLPKEEEVIGSPLSPYAVTKLVNEIYAGVYAKTFGFGSIGLRYFNVFGPRQDPSGPYAAVIPLWVKAVLNGEPIYINGDGSTSRDFCFIENVVRANILASVISVGPEAKIYNIACGEATSLTQLSALIIEAVRQRKVTSVSAVKYRDFRRGDVKHSLASVERAKNELGYTPVVQVPEGIQITVDWLYDRTKL